MALAAGAAGKPAGWSGVRALGRTLAALVLGLMAVAMCISVAAIVYQGPLKGFLDRAIAFALIAGTVTGIAADGGESPSLLRATT